MPKEGPVAGPISIWGGVECTVNRVGEEFFDQIQYSGHVLRESDIDRIASLGISACRYPALWEHVAPDSLDELRFDWLDRRLTMLRDAGVEPIAGLLHHGSGPRYTSLVDPEFADKFAVYARAVAERYPWISSYTPVNEPLTTARFSGLYGLWYPHGNDDRTFVRCLLNECRGTVLAMREIRRVNSDAKLIQTEDLGKIHGSDRLRYQCDFENERRWLSWDLLCGRVDKQHPMWSYLRRARATEDELNWFLDNPCAPDIVGANYYVTSERYLDHDIRQYPDRCVGGNGRHLYADVEAVRVLGAGIGGFEGVLNEAWARYGLPVAITEAHLGCTREEQQRWLRQAYEGAVRAREQGADVRAVTVWSLFGSYNWSCLLTADEGCYEPGVFDLRSPEPRETALAHTVRELASGQAPSQPTLTEPGWWQRDIRFEYLPQGRSMRSRSVSQDSPLLIAGGYGRLGRAVARACELRGIPYRQLGRSEMDIANPDSVCQAIAEHKPWAIFNAAGFERRDEADTLRDVCMRENAKGPAVLALACAEAEIGFVTISTDQVFDGSKMDSYIESDHPKPPNTYGESKAIGERIALSLNPKALVIRTGRLFSQLEHRAELDRILSGRLIKVESATLESPTYAPDMLEAALNLLLDGESGVWHLASRGQATAAEFTAVVSQHAGIRVRMPESEGVVRSFALASEKAWIMPDLEGAIARCMKRLETTASPRAYVS